MQSRLSGNSPATCFLLVGMAVALSGLTSIAETEYEVVDNDLFDHRHSSFAQVLQNIVSDNGRVNYALIKSDPDQLHKYLRELARVDSELYRSWFSDQQLAYLINLYNAQTIDLILRNYPIDSIKDIGNLWRGPWGQPVVSLMGRITTLDYLEHKLIRPTFNDPRVHFALVCAAKSAPALLNEPYIAERLQDQLNEQTRLFILDNSRNVIDLSSGILHLSMVFKWFSSDFESQAGSLDAYIRQFLPEETAARMHGRTFAIRHLEYDWSLNDSSSP